MASPLPKQKSEPSGNCGRASSKFMHMACGGERVSTHWHQWLERLVRIYIGRRGSLVRHRSLRAALSDERHFKG